MTEREALKLIADIASGSTTANSLQNIAKIAQEALAQPEQEPVAVVAEVHMSRYTIEWTNGPLPEGTKLYTTPPQRKPLTWEQQMRIHNECGDSVSLAIALTEAAHGIKE